MKRGSFSEYPDFQDSSIGIIAIDFYSISDTLMITKVLLQVDGWSDITHTSFYDEVVLS